MGQGGSSVQSEKWPSPRYIVRDSLGIGPEAKELVRPEHLGGPRAGGGECWALEVLSLPGPWGLPVTQQDSSSLMHSHVEDSGLDHLFSHLFTQQMFIQLLFCARNEEGAGGVRWSLCPCGVIAQQGRGRLI